MSATSSGGARRGAVGRRGAVCVCAVVHGHTGPGLLQVAAAEEAKGGEEETAGAAGHLHTRKSQSVPWKMLANALLGAMHICLKQAWSYSFLSASDARVTQTGPHGVPAGTR